MANKTFFNIDLFTRILTSLILGPIVLLIAYEGGLALKFAILLVATLMSFEWNKITAKSGSSKHPALWKIIGMFYIAIPCTAILFISEQTHGNKILIWLLLTVWSADTSAFFSGKLIGGPKLAPKISPNKTWAGFLSSVSLSYFVGLQSVHFLDPQHPRILIALTMTLTVYAQIGDLVESWIKRRFSTKDSGRAIPGHGGILDRVDGIVLTAPKVAFVVFYYNVFFQQ
jgi:phosphatidate cytidylyltransferase